MNSEKRDTAYLPFVFTLLPFLVLATANSAGYRYGASDLAFYGPAVMRHLDPQLFPRDRVVIDAQAHLTLMDETVGTLARLTIADLPLLFLVLYLVSLTLLAASGTAIGATLYRHQWSTAALIMALTLRHAIVKSGTNTLEAYFHPRQLAFAFGAVALAAFLRGRTIAAAAALGGAALLHPTTTLWFAVWLGVAVFVSERRWRVPLLILAGASALAIVWAAVAGPLAGRLGRMDDEWLAAIAEKDYLFPLDWPPLAWLLNLAYVPIIWFIYRRRAGAGLMQPRERAVVLGACSLLLVFLFTLPLTAWRLALAIQLQPARVFWMLDFLAIVYVIWAIADAGGSRRAMLVTAAVIVFSVVRGLYVMRVEFPNRPLFEATVPGDWGRVMAWARTTPRETGWLADPNHAAEYGTSVRMAGARDVFVEGTKDSAIGMYDRAVALRTRDRVTEIREFAELTPERARQLGSEYDLDYLISERDMALPLAFAAGRIRVYRLR